MIMIINNGNLQANFTMRYMFELTASERLAKVLQEILKWYVKFFFITGGGGGSSSSTDD